MSRCLRFPLALLIPFIVLSAASVQATQEAKLIELRDGTVFEDCEFTENLQYKLIEVECADAAGKVRYAEINRILNRDGDDITEEILGEYYRPPVEQDSEETTSEESSGWISKEKDTVGSASSQESDWETEAERSRRPNRKPYSLALVGHGDFGVPFGEWYEGINTGFGFGADLSIPINHKYGIRIGFVRTTSTTDLPFRGTVIEEDLKLNRFGLLLSAEYYSWPDWKAGNGVSYHLWSGIGVMNESFSGQAIVLDPGTNEYYTVMGGSSETHFQMGLSGSIMTMVSSGVGAEISFGMQLIPVGADDYGAVQYGYAIDLSLGLVGLVRPEE